MISKYGLRTGAVLLASVLALAACGYNPKQIDIKPKDEPVYNYTQSSGLLECVGSLVDRDDVSSLDVYISNIPDHTVPTIEAGFLTKNAVMMVTTAIDRLGTQKVNVVGRDGGMKGRHQVQILGAFTELNRTTESGALSGESVFPGGVKLDFGGDKNVNHIALDLSMSERNRIVPGTSTSVAIQIHGNSGNATLTYDEGGDFAAIGALGFTAQEGFHAAERLLVETSVALMLSKYYDIDIRNCLHETGKLDAQRPVNAYDRAVFETVSDDRPVMPVMSVTNPYVSPLAAQERGYQSSSSRPSAPPETSQFGHSDNVLQIDNSPFYGGGVGGAQSFTMQDRLDFKSLTEEDRKLPQANGYVYIPRDGKKKYLLQQPDMDQGTDSTGYSGIYNPE